MKNLNLMILLVIMAFVLAGCPKDPVPDPPPPPPKAAAKSPLLISAMDRTGTWSSTDCDTYILQIDLACG